MIWQSPQSTDVFGKEKKKTISLLCGLSASIDRPTIVGIRGSVCVCAFHFRKYPSVRMPRPRYTQGNGWLFIQPSTTAVPLFLPCICVSFLLRRKLLARNEKRRFNHWLKSFWSIIMHYTNFVVSYYVHDDDCIFQKATPRVEPENINIEMKKINCFQCHFCSWPGFVPSTLFFTSCRASIQSSDQISIRRSSHTEHYSYRLSLISGLEIGQRFPLLNHVSFILISWKGMKPKRGITKPLLEWLSTQPPIIGWF